MTRKRQRGIKASVYRLQQALESSGLKTQTALADKIADLEELENPPRGLVNKVFRGESVDPRSIQRVAVALEVEAWTLYEDRAHTPARPVMPAEAPASPDQARSVWPWAALAVVLAATGIFAMFDQDPGAMQDKAPSSQEDRIAQPASFVVLPAAGDSSQFHAVLGTALQRFWRQLPAAIADGFESGDAQLIAEKPGVDYVLELRISNRGRWQDILINAHRSGSMQAVWQSAFPRSASQQRKQKLMNQAAAAVVAVKPGDTLAANSRDAQRKYLVGRVYLDKARIPDNVRRALTEFESAIRLDPNYAGAHAGLCEALVVEHIRTGEMSRLDEAEAPCARALELQPELPEVLIAQALLDRKSGRHAPARAGLERVLRHSPKNVDAAMGLAEVLLGDYARGQDGGALEQARGLLDQAAEVEPEFWKIPYQQARFSYMAGELNIALAQADAAARMDANPLVLSNLGTLQFCAGDFSAAKTSYQLAGERSPESFIGSGQMAVIDYNLGRFDAAVDGFGAALERHRQSGAAEDHRLWGNYADALRHSGRHAEARQAYSTAIALADRHVHDGDGQPMHAVARLYYQAMLAVIDPDPGASPLDMQKLADLASRSDSLDAIYKIYLAIIHQMQGLDAQAGSLLEAGSQGCPGLAVSPDIRAR